MGKVPSVQDIVDALFALPPEQINTVYEFILFLQTRHGQGIDISDDWTEEDLTDLTNASLQYASDIGHLSDRDWKGIQSCLKQALPLT